MKAVHLTRHGGPETLELVETPDPTPTSAQVVVRVAACGVCGHDTADRAGKLHIDLPTVLGHEISGDVVAVGSAVRNVQVGDRVACKQYHTCGWCTPCRTGNELRCATKSFVYGGYAEYVALEEDLLVQIPDNVSMQDAALTACAVGSCLQALDDVAHLQAGETVVVTGAGGGLGLHAMQVAAAMGARVIAVTSSVRKQALLLEHGADDVVLSTDDLAGQITELTSGRGPEVVLDNVGHPDVFRGCFKALGFRGRYVLTGQLYRQKINLYPAFVFFKEAVITGSASTSTASFLRAMDLVAEKKVHGVTEEFSLTNVVDAHAAVDASRVLGRAVLIP